MDIKLFSLMKGEPSAFSGSKKLISDCANSFTSEEEKFKSFSSPKRLMLAVSQALRSTDAVIVAVQGSAYNSVKKMICSAFNLETAQNEEVYSVLLPCYEKKKITESALKNNALFPMEAEIFSVSDYKCCGFSVTSGAQSIVVLPLDSVKTAEVVFGSLYEFLAEAAGADDEEALSGLKRARIAERLMQVLKKNQLKTAFAALSGVQLIEEGAYVVDPEHDYMFIAEKPKPRLGEQPIQDYIVSVAQSTRMNSKADYACAVSSAFASNNDNSTFIYYAVAGEEDTFVTKLYAKKDESPKQLYRAAAEKAMLACVNKISSDVAAAKSRVSREDKLMKQKLTLITAGALAAATGICAVAALLLN